ncbi:nucleoside triphosphate pyrophosphohydrolase family protein [Mycolicibacterium lacusdiani]|uniref:nucleoside triphosphate pyrophosphohydrolase family protein n=1 Tax=Mycolicibacterium lacusdiani TaxID=2895283 RepID=UPI001F3C5173|nr:nucleoside triphosphate pyrophosphohydrolase family protein [Mycolicibacterium lacusdiani]
MEIDDYQRRTRETAQPHLLTADRGGGAPVSPLVVYLLGLAGEAGSVDTVYKKYLRDGEAYGNWKMQLREELGDVLWYVAAIAAEAELTLDDIATANLHKTQSRWLPSTNYQLDAAAPPAEQLPRSGTMEFREIVNADGRPEVTVWMDSRQLGQPLTDNSLDEDGYRFHDVFHLTYAAVLGWSPQLRKMLGCKRKSTPDIDNAEDGGRAIVTEEGLAHLAFAYGSQQGHLAGIERLDQALLDVIAMMTSKFEVGARTAADWEVAILQGHRMFRELIAHHGGSVTFDADQRVVVFTPPAPENAA